MTKMQTSQRPSSHPHYLALVTHRKNSDAQVFARKNGRKKNEEVKPLETQLFKIDMSLEKL